MLSFTSLLVLSLVLSAVVYFLYKVFKDSSKSVYRSKVPLALVDRQDHFKNPASQAAPTENAAAFGKGGEHSTPKNFARTYPALPAGSVDWRWEGSGVQLRELQTQPGESKGHCSLFDVYAQQAAAKRDPYAGMPHREEVSKPTGRSYNVTRKTERTAGDEDRDLHKPWGW